MLRAQQRTWFPFILAGLTIALALGVWAWIESRPDISTVIERTAPTSQEYQLHVSGIVQTYLSSGDARAAYDQLLDVVVPTDARDVHLDFVIAFGKLVAGDEEGASLLGTLRSDNDWLP